MTVTTAPASTRRERTGWYFYDWANSAFSTTVITVFLGPFLTSVTEQAAGCPLGADECTGRVHPLGISVPPGSFFKEQDGETICLLTCGTTDRPDSDTLSLIFIRLVEESRYHLLFECIPGFPVPEKIGDADQDIVEHRLGFVAVPAQIS